MLDHEQPAGAHAASSAVGGVGDGDGGGGVGDGGGGVGDGDGGGVVGGGVGVGDGGGGVGPRAAITSDLPGRRAAHLTLSDRQYLYQKAVANTERIVDLLRNRRTPTPAPTGNYSPPTDTLNFLVFC